MIGDLSMGRLAQGIRRTWNETPFLGIPLVCFAITAVLFEPEAVTELYPGAHKVYQLAGYVVVFLSFLTLLRGHGLPRALPFFLALTASAVGSTALAQDNGLVLTSVSDLVQAGARSILVCALVAHELECNRTGFLRGASAYFELLALATLATIILWPEGLWRTAYTDEPCFLLGHKNGILLALLPGIVLVSMRSLDSRGTLDIRALLHLAVILLSVVMAGSATSAVGATLLLAMALVSRHATKRLPIGPIALLVAGLLLTYCLAVLHIQNLFAPFIEGVLHRSTDLSSRSGIWERAISLIAQHPLMGTGELAVVSMRAKLDAFNAHNAYLNTLLCGGWVRMAIYLGGAAVLGARMRGGAGTHLYNMVVAVLAIYAVTGLFEVVVGNMPFMVSMTCCACCDYLSHGRSRRGETTRGAAPWSDATGARSAPLRGKAAPASLHGQREGAR